MVPSIKYCIASDIRKITHELGLPMILIAIFKLLLLTFYQFYHGFPVFLSLSFFISRNGAYCPWIQNSDLPQNLIYMLHIHPGMVILYTITTKAVQWLAGCDMNDDGLSENVIQSRCGLGFWAFNHLMPKIFSPAFALKCIRTSWVPYI